MRIDGHQHFWKADRGDYHWMSPAVPVLCRDYLPGDLLPHLVKHGIERTILVQAAQTFAETDYLLALAEAGRADYLVTGDKADLLPLRTYRGARIIAPRAFAHRLQD